jgi:phage host-nuclease inhibitor protein Gam
MEDAMDVEALVRTAETMESAGPLRAMPPELAEYEDAENPEVRGGWQIQTPASADWALLRLAECEAEEAEITRQEEAAIKRVRERAEALRAKAARGGAYFRFKLLVYAEDHRGEIVKGKKKSRDFLHGRIGFRKRGGKLVVKEAAALEEWLLAQPVEAGLYRMKIAPEMRALQEAAKRDGIVPPGCDWEIEYEDVHIEASAPETALAKGE